MQRFWNSSDRLLLTLVMAAIVHALIILGIKFDLPKPANIKKSLEITLVNTFFTTAPEKADFLAPENQIDAGANPEKAAPKSVPTPAPGAGVASLPAPDVAKASEIRPKQVLHQVKSEKKVATDTGDVDEPEVANPHLNTDTLAQQVAEISAELNRSQADHAHGPKIVEIDQVSANKYKAAAYERGWQDKIERIGTLNFPDEARRKGLSGSLMLSVGLKADGSIYSIRIDKSSGHQVLDDAAQRIVRLAAPYAPFPMELRQEGDVLVITRKWTFFADNRVETTP